MRRPRRALIGLLCALALVAALPAWAHVTVWPRESKAGASEKYVIRVPTEGQVDTMSVELEIPADVTVSLVGAPLGWTQTVKKDGARVVAITWTMTIKPGEFAEFPFIARNPKAGDIAWKAHQRFADGSVTHWTAAPGERTPASVTKLTP